MQTLLFVPCLAQDLYPHVAMAAAKLLETAGFTPAVPAGHTCCGQPLYKQGHLQRTRKVAANCVRAFAGEEHIVSPSASCTSMVRGYPELLDTGSGDAFVLQQARDMARRMFELCEFLQAFAPKWTPPPWPDESGPVIHHDSCQSRGLGVSDAVRGCLGRVSGLKLLEMENPAACCGFGGAFSLEFPEISEAILEDKLEAICQQAEESGAKAVVTGEISCMGNLRAGLAARQSGLQVLHVAEILAGTAHKGQNDV